MSVLTAPLPASTGARTGYALFATRVVTAAVFLYHGVPKALDASMAMDKFVGFGLPGVLGPMIGWVEVVFGVTLLVGLWTRASSLVLAAVIAGALVTVQIPGGISAGLERDALVLVATLVLAAAGPGAVAVDTLRGTRRRP